MRYSFGTYHNVRFQVQINWDLAARAIEKQDIEKAVSMYTRAIEAIQGYASITYEKGLVGQLLEEEAAELGISGEINVLDRLTICLVKIGKAAEAAQYQ